MAIIRELPEYKAPYEVMLNLYPDQFIDEGLVYHSLLKKNLRTNEDGKLVDDDGNAVPMPKQHVKETVKNSDVWKKINMDYFYTVALSQYFYKRKHVDENYGLIKGKLTAASFAQEGPVMGIMDTIIKDADLPSYVKDYQIMAPPINAMVGEKSKRPDTSRAKAMDATSKLEEKDHYTKLYQQMIYQKAQQEIQEQLEQEGVDTSNAKEFQQQVEQMTQEKIKNEMVSYSSEGEKWANHILEDIKIEYNLKELFEEGFRDLLIINAEYLHIYEDKSRLGFKIDCLNDKYTWYLTTPDKKYTRDAYAAGIIQVMEISEILDKYDLPEEEIDHLRKYAIQAFFPYSRETNINDSRGRGTGIDSIKYDVFDPAILNERMKMEAALTHEGAEDLDGFLANAAPNVGTFGNRFVVTTAYWKSKKKMGLLTYIDKNNIEQSDLVDDNYEDGTHPREKSIEWGWINQWYKGIQIGTDIYHVEPLECLDYCPIIGVTHEIKNTRSTSLLDMMKQWQSLYNVCMNQVWRYLEKEKGKILVFNKRFIPLLKGDDYQYSEDVWLRQMEEEGICFIDDSPDNLKSPSGFNQFTVQDMTMTDVINGRMELAMRCRTECWKLIGLNEERLGQVQASQTATGTNTAVTQSYAQTEPYFMQQEYLENQILQAILDISQYITCKKGGESSLGFINSEGENMWNQINTELDLKNRDIKLFISSRAEDQRKLEKLDGLTQAMLQNGVSAYEVASLYDTNSYKQKLDMLKKLKEIQDQMMQQKIQGENDASKAEQEASQAELQQKIKEHDDEVQLKIYEIDTKANSQLHSDEVKEAIEMYKINNQPIDYKGFIDSNQKAQKEIADRDLAEIKLRLEKDKLANQQTKDQHEMKQKDQKLALEKRNIDSREKMHSEDMRMKKAQQSKSSK